MDKDYIIFQENGLFGAKNQRGEVIIPPQYMEMYSFSCGLAMVRDTEYRYGYINKNNEFVIPLGKYSWCDPRFTCGFARVIGYVHHEKEESILMTGKWGIIDTLGYARLIDIPVTKEMTDAANSYRYNHKVFMFPFWKEIYINDAERKQDVEEAERTFRTLKKEYENFGYETIDVPLLTPQSRAEWILGHL